jgi:hypothetical protein
MTESKGKLIVSFSTHQVGPHFEHLSPGAKRFIDAECIQYEAKLELATVADYTSFIVGWLVRGLTEQQKMKCLLPSSIQYLSHSPGDDPPVHGHCLSIRDGLITLPINQELEVGTKFHLSISNVEPIKVEPGDKPPMYAITALSDKLQPLSKLPPKLKPFSNRAYLLHVLPGETLDATYVVGYSNRFSLREMTYFERPTPNTLIFGTTLGRNPSDLLRTVAAQLKERMEEKAGNVYLEQLRASGFDQTDREKITAIIEKLFVEIEKLK